MREIKEIFRHLAGSDESEIEDSKHYIYVMQSADLRGFIKIGISKNIGLRSAKPKFDLDYFNGGAFGRIECEDIQAVWRPIIRNKMEFSSRRLAKTFEMLMHYVMRDYRLHGEYFYVGSKGMKLLDRIIADIVKFSSNTLGEEILTKTDEQDELDDF